MTTRYIFPERPGAFPTTPLMHVAGAAPGPRLVVTGPRAVLEPMAHRVWDMTDLPGMRGVLILRLDCEPMDVDRPDHVMRVSGEAGAALAALIDRMSDLGMIARDHGPMRRVA